jgi:hypothetical protein
MARHFILSARNIQLRLASTGVTIRVEDDNQDRSGKLQVAKTGITWTPKRAWGGGPRSIRIIWEDVPAIFSRYHETL